MTKDLIQPNKTLGYTDIYLDFVAGNNPPKKFYLADNLETVAQKLDQVNYDREKIVSILKRQNRAFGASDKTFRNIERLLDPKAVCVLSGQQAGFLGGPLFSVIKMVANVKAAEKYEKQLNRPVIPVFWIAGDDHDFAEVNHLFVLDRQGEPHQIQYKTEPEKEYPTAEIKFDDREELERALSSVKECLGESDFTPELFNLIDRTYTTEDSYVTAFGKFMAGITRELGLVLFCPCDDEVKEHAIPLFKDIVAKQDELHQIIASTNQSILDSGYHIQVEKKDDATHLFYNIDGRKPVMHLADKFSCGEKVVDHDGFLQCITETPGKISPDVMTRPIMQSYLLPTIEQKCGPSELAYLAQINPVFELFGLPAPVHRARPTVTILEKRFEKMMQQNDITFEEITGDIEQVVNRILAETFPEDLEREFKEAKSKIGETFEKLQKDTLDFDPSLKKFSRQTFGKIDYSLKNFENKVFSSHKKKEQETRDRIYRLWRAIYPNRRFQERTMNITYFIARYGMKFIRFIYDQMDVDEKAHQILKLSEYDFS